MSRSLRVRALLATFLFLTTAFAGCIGDDETVTPEATQGVGGEATPEEAEAQAKANMTDDGSGDFDDEALGHQPHLHDYWTGRERVTLLDDDVEANPFSAMGFTFFQLFVRRNAAVGGAFVTLPDGASVYEGTGKMEITVTWEDPLVTGMVMRYRSAASPDFSEGLTVTPGQPIEIEVTPEMTDMPHDSTTRWRFFFEPGSGQSVAGAFHVKVDIVKMRDIGLFPGHPELFNGKPSKVLLDTDAQSSQESGPNQFARFITDPSAEPADEGVAPTEIVPMETLEMRVDVTVTNAQTSIGEASEVYLLYRSADTGQQRWAERIEADETTGVYAFAIPVEMRMVDSPYADESQWRFDLRVGSTLVSGTDMNCGGCTDAQIQYHITVTAFDHYEYFNERAVEDDDN